MSGAEEIVQDRLPEVISPHSRWAADHYFSVLGRHVGLEATHLLVLIRWQTNQSAMTYQVTLKALDLDLNYVVNQGRFGD